MTAIPRRVLVLLIVGVLAVAALFLYLRPASTIKLYADFAQADGMFVGSDVAVLGVKLGKVTDLEPRGSHVRLTLTMPEDTKIPANAEAWVMSPNVVSDQYIELTPPYESGRTLGDGGVIDVEHTRSPIKWDKLVNSVNELLVTFGPEGANSDGSIGRLLDRGAALLDGRGKKVRQAILEISQATEVANGEMPAVADLMKSLDQLVQILADNKSTVDSVTRSVDEVAGEFAAQEENIATAIVSLSSVIDEVTALVDKHGEAITGSVRRLADVSVQLARHQDELIEIMDVFPLASENISRAVKDGKLRVRLDFSTANFSQTDGGKALCGLVGLEQLCSGPGFINPIELPPDFGTGILSGGG